MSSSTKNFICPDCQVAVRDNYTLRTHRNRRHAESVAREIAAATVELSGGVSIPVNSFQDLADVATAIADGRVICAECGELDFCEPSCIAAGQFCQACRERNETAAEVIVCDVDGERFADDDSYLAHCAATHEDAPDASDELDGAYYGDDPTTDGPADVEAMTREEREAYEQGLIRELLADGIRAGHLRKAADLGIEISGECASVQTGDWSDCHCFDTDAAPVAAAALRELSAADAPAMVRRAAKRSRSLGAAAAAAHPHDGELVSAAGTPIKLCPTCGVRRIPATKKDCKPCRKIRLSGGAVPTVARQQEGLQSDGRDPGSPAPKTAARRKIRPQLSSGALRELAAID